MSLIQGVKGSDCYDSTGNACLDLSVQLVRGLAPESIRTGLDAMLLGATPEGFEDAFVLTFQTRNIRGGKGERALSECMLSHLLDKYPPLTQSLLEFVPRYGCWRDLVALAERCPAALPSVLSLFKEQLLADALMAEGASLSLCAKWAPRESSHFSMAKQLANSLYPEVKELSLRLRHYRKLVAGLNRRLQTTEIKMCANDWEEIQPQKVPGRCLQKHRKAFLNEQVHTHVLRHPESLVRNACREHFQDFFAKAARGEVKMVGSQTVYPHEVIRRILDTHPQDMADDERNLLRGQWLSFVNKAKEAGSMRRMKAMCDFSGSMDGIPKLICTALGLLIAEVSGSNEILTFDSLPQVHSFRPGSDIFEKVESLQIALGQGLSTDFQKAMDLVLEEIVRKRMRPDEIPTDLIVFTDMGWDQACASDESSSYTSNRYRHVVKTEMWQTHLGMIRESFRRAGETMWGEPFQPPRIVIWNLRAEYKDFHAKADEEGVLMLSGWSPSLFKIFQEKGAVLGNPLEALRAQLDDPLYDPVRQRVRDWVSIHGMV